MPDLLIVVLVPPLLIVSTLLLAHVEARVAATRRLPAPPSPRAGLAPAAQADAEARLDTEGAPGARGGAHAQTRPHRGHRRIAERVPPPPENQPGSARQRHPCPALERD